MTLYVFLGLDPRILFHFAFLRSALMRSNEKDGRVKPGHDDYGASYFAAFARSTPSMIMA